MNRESAITKYAEIRLKELTVEERADQLGIMLLENWDTANYWMKLTKSVIDEFNGEELVASPESGRYDEVLKIWIKYDIAAVSNTYLKSQLEKHGYKMSEIRGAPEDYYSCPCCGRKTLEERGSYDICVVCWWEDCGLDNDDADKVLGGPNENLSLAQARYNFLTMSIYNPKRIDLLSAKEEKEKYELGRVFILVGNNKVSEPQVSREWEIAPNSQITT